MQVFAEKYAYGPTRVQFENKDPRGFAEFKSMLAEHSALGARNTQLGVQRERPSLYDLVDQMKALRVPTLILTGSEDGAHPRAAALKARIPDCEMKILHGAGHACQIEQPWLFDRYMIEFLKKHRLFPSGA